MSTPQFTPGPWVVSGDWIEDVVGPGTCRRRIAIIDDGAGIDCPQANACLIAAAPDLYGALNACLNSMIILADQTLEIFKDKRDDEGLYSWTAGHYRRMKTAAQQARAALAKARGEA